MRGVLGSSTLAALLLAVALADRHHHHEHGHAGDTNCHRLSSPNAEFAFALYKTLNRETSAGKNIFFSPLGISTILSMLSAGARGDTHSQLFSSLGYSSLSQSQVNEAYEHLFRMHGNIQEDQQLDVGNAVALHSEFNPRNAFLNDVKRYYSGDIFNVDFTRDEAVAEINTYIANKTRNKIKDMVNHLDPQIAMVLINYVYFKGQWYYPFESWLTRTRDFHVNDTSKVRVEMMQRTEDYKTYLDTNMQVTVIILPYEGNTSMMVVLPDNGKMEDVERNINKNHIKHWRDSATLKNVDLYFPTFSISFDASLDKTLNELGITNAFQDSADFSGVSDAVRLKVSKAFHKATLDVTERGTEAAAGSTIETDLLASGFFSTSLPVIIDRPFLVFILENPTESILFMGKINNPTAT